MTKHAKSAGFLSIVKKVYGDGGYAGDEHGGGAGRARRVRSVTQRPVGGSRRKLSAGLPSADLP